MHKKNLIGNAVEVESNGPLQSGNTFAGHMHFSAEKRQNCKAIYGLLGSKGYPSTKNFGFQILNQLSDNTFEVAMTMNLASPVTGFAMVNQKKFKLTDYTGLATLVQDNGSDYDYDGDTLVDDGDESTNLKKRPMALACKYDASNPDVFECRDDLGCFTSTASRRML